MTSSLGGYQYESTTTRALGSITPESYDWRDQGKVMSKLVTDVSYMAGLQRKMQKGIDDANKNFIQQIQSLFTDLLVILGGSGDTGFDWGDLKYIFQAIGAMFGLSPGMPFPINLFGAAWHFFSNYILPVGNFEEAINVFIDSAIATMLDIFGEIPIVGEALQQLAVIISNIRDSLGPLFDALEALFGVFDGDWASAGLGWFGDLMTGLNEIFSPILGPINGVLSQIFAIIGSWTVPFVDLLTDVVDVITNILRMVTGGLDYRDFNNTNFNPITMIAAMIGNLIQNGILGIASALNAQNIFGIIQSWNIPFLPLSHLTNTDGPNILVEPGFDDPEAIQLGVAWSYDSTQGHTSLGSAKVIGTSLGQMREAVSNIGIPVSSGEKIRVKGWMRWQGIVYSGVPLSVNLNLYKHGVLDSSVGMLVPVAPATNQLTWTQYDSGEYTIPADVTSVKVSLRLAGSVTAGSVWFDDLEFRKIGNTIPQNWITDLLGTLDNIRFFIGDVIDTIISVIRGIPFVGGGLADLLEWLTSWFDDTEDTAAVASDAKLGVQATQNIIVGSTTASTTTPTSATDTDVQLALDAQTQAIVSQGAALQAIIANNTSATNSTIQVMDDFEADNDDHLDNTLWTTYALSGSLANVNLGTPDGHNAQIVFPSGSASNTGNVLAVYTKSGEESSDSDYQKVTTTIATAHVYPGFGDSRTSGQCVYARISDDGTTAWVRAYVTNRRRLVVDYKNGGSSGTLYDSGDNAVDWPGPGSQLSIEAGVDASPRAFKIWIGNKPVRLVTDGSSVTAMGATYRRRGFGLFIDGGYWPGAFTQFNAVDNLPPNVRGVGFKAYKSNTYGDVTIPVGGSLLPASTMDVVKQITPGLSWNDSTQALTVDIDGWYWVQLKVRTSERQGNSRRWVTWVELDGVTEVELDDITANDISPQGSSSAGAFPRNKSIGGGGGPIYIEAGQVLKFGCEILTTDSFGTSFAGHIIGDANGQYSWATVVLLNRTVT